MYESISKNNELENEMTLDMSYFWYSDNSVSTSAMSLMLCRILRIVRLQCRTSQVTKPAHLYLVSKDKTVL